MTSSLPLFLISLKSVSRGTSKNFHSTAWQITAYTFCSFPHAFFDYNLLINCRLKCSNVITPTYHENETGNLHVNTKKTIDSNFHIDFKSCCVRTQSKNKIPSRTRSMLKINMLTVKNVNVVNKKGVRVRG